MDMVATRRLFFVNVCRKWCIRMDVTRLIIAALVESFLNSHTARTTLAGGSDER
jgi:hypothetical protein